jgi:multiple sugar transport system permease protein
MASSRLDDPAVSASGLAAVREGPRRGAWRYRFSRATMPYFMLAPAIFAVVLVLGFPILFNMYVSFTDTSGYTGLGNRDWVGLGNYQYIFSDSDFRSALQLTFLWTFANLIGQLGLGLLLALVLHDGPLRLTKVLQPLWLLPWFLPSVSIFFVWQMLYDPTFGQVQHVLGSIGVASANGVLSDPTWAVWGIIVAGVWKGFPFYMVAFYSALQAVPQEVYDAARVDGAGRLSVLRHIELPELRGILATVGILGFMWVFNWFTPVYIMTQGGPGSATMTVAIYIYEQAMREFFFGVAASAGSILLAVVVVLFAVVIVVQRFQEHPSV